MTHSCVYRSLWRRAGLTIWGEIASFKLTWRPRLWDRHGDCASDRRCGAASSDWSVLQTQLLCVGRHLDAKKNQDSLSPVTVEGELCIWPSDARAAPRGLIPFQVQEDKVLTGLTVFRFLLITGDHSYFLQSPHLQAAFLGKQPGGRRALSLGRWQSRHRCRRSALFPPAQPAREGVVPESFAVWWKEARSVEMKKGGFP